MEQLVLALQRKLSNVTCGHRPQLSIVCFHNGLNGVSAQFSAMAALKKGHALSPGRQ